MGGRVGTGNRARVVLVSTLGMAAAIALPDATAASAAPTSTSTSTTTPATPLTPVGSVPSLPAGTTPTGSTSAQSPIQLSILLRSSDPAGLAATALAVSTPGSPEFRDYLTPAQVQAQFGPSPSAAAAVDSYLSAHGFAVGPTLADGLLVTATGTAGDATGALHTGIMNYRQRSGRLVYANTSVPRVPSDLAPDIQTVTGLDDTVQFQPHVIVRKRQSQVTSSKARSADARSARARSDTTLPTTSSSTTSSTTTSSSTPSSTTSTSASSSSTSTSASAATSTTTTSTTTGTGRSSLAGVSGAATPCQAASSEASGSSAYTANQLAVAYGFSSSYTSGDFGKGVTVALFELAAFDRQNVNTFEQCYGIKTKVTTVAVAGGNGSHRGTVESELDIENVASLAPSAHILVYEAPDSEAGALDDYGTIASQDRAQVVSTSWGECEPELLTSYYEGEAQIFQEMDLQGQSVFAASGDSGSEDCATTQGASDEDGLAVDDPASQLWVTGVGGTDLTSAGSSPSETVWNDSSGASGGGISTLWSMNQNWQLGPGVVNQYSTGSSTCLPLGTDGLCREVPDVAASASPANGYVEYCTKGGACKGSGGWMVVGGTSGAAPLWAALAAVADSGLSEPIGFVNKLLYEIASNPSQRNAFNEITTGNNDWTGTNHGLYPATPGYNMATGLGSPNGNVLIPLLRAG